MTKVPITNTAYYYRFLEQERETTIREKMQGTDLKKIKSKRYTESNREKSNVANAILEKNYNSIIRRILFLKIIH